MIKVFQSLYIKKNPKFNTAILVVTSNKQKKQKQKQKTKKTKNKKIVTLLSQGSFWEISLLLKLE